MTTTLQNFLRELTFIQIPDIKRHAKGLLIALEKSNRKDFLEYEIKPPEKDDVLTEMFGEGGKEEIEEYYKYKNKTAF